MKKLLEELDVAYKLISAIAVSGDAVDIMATAKAKIRMVCEELKKNEGETKGKTE